MYEYFDHTADLGIRVRAPDLSTLFCEAAEALFGAIVDNLDAVRPERKVEVRLEPDDLEYLLFDWLDALLRYFDTEHLVFGRFAAEVDGGVRGEAWGEPLDLKRHHAAHEVKAITYHGFKVAQENGDWVAEFIVDI